MHIYKKKRTDIQEKPRRGGGGKKLSGGTYLEHDCESLRDAIVCFYGLTKRWDGESGRFFQVFG